MEHIPDRYRDGVQTDNQKIGIMKATHTYKRNGQPCGHVRIQFTIDAHDIAQELWRQVEHGYRKPGTIAENWNREKVEELVRERVEGYGIYAYQGSDFEEWVNLSNLQKAQYYVQAKVWFRDFFTDDSIDKFIEDHN